MARHEWQIGEIKVTVDAPDGVPVSGARVDVTPADREQFLAAAQAVGGLETLNLPQHERAYAQSAYAYNSDEPRDRLVVAIEEPPLGRKAPGIAAHPFFGPLAERVERERALAEEGS